MKVNRLGMLFAFLSGMWTYAQCTPHLLDESETKLIQELVSEGTYAIKRYEPTMDKIMRMPAVTSRIENSFAHLPDKAA
jgi:hypothetical protein